MKLTKFNLAQLAAQETEVIEEVVEKKVKPKATKKVAPKKTKK